MATVQEYLDKQKVARNAAETVKRQVRRAYDVAQEGTKQPGDMDDRLDLLENDAARITFKNTLVAGLVGPYATAIGGMPGDPEIAQALVLNGALGFSPAKARGIVDTMKEKMSYDGLMKILDEKTDWQKALETRLSVPASILDQVTADDVARYVGIAPTNIDKMTLNDKLELVGIFEQLGIVPPKALKDKAYM